MNTTELYAQDLPAHKPSCTHYGHLIHDDDTCECAARH